MSELLTFTVAPTRTAPVEGIRAAGPHEVTDCSKCEMNINVGIFFDGTNNNRDADRPDLKHTNIVRLWETYKDKPSQGYFPIYVPGVGTEFKEIREQGTSMFGAGFGEGAEQRVLYALVALLNAIHRTACNGQPLLSYGQIAALCCTGWNPAAESDVAELAKLGLSSGMKMAGAKGNENRDDILRSLVALLQQRLRSAKPRVKECFVDVFGFSRGAASLEKKASLFSGRSARHDARPAGRDDSEKREALEILQIAKQTATDECMRFHGLFDGFVHDSLAGFDLHMAELSGHWRYRKGFLGSDDVRTVDAITASTSDNAA